MQGCQGPNGAFPRGAPRRRPWQQARRCGDRLPISAERPQEPGGPERGRGAQGPGASHQGTEQSQTERRRSSAPRRRPRSVTTAPGGSVWTPLWTPRCSVLPKAGPRRLAVPTALDAPEASLPQEQKLGRQPRPSPPIRVVPLPDLPLPLFRALTLSSPLAP